MQWEAEETPAPTPTAHLRVPARPPGRGSWPSPGLCASQSQENGVVSTVLKAEAPGAPQVAGSGWFCPALDPNPKTISRISLPPLLGVAEEPLSPPGRGRLQCRPPPVCPHCLFPRNHRGARVSDAKLRADVGAGPQPCAASGVPPPHSGGACGSTFALRGAWHFPRAALWRGSGRDWGSAFQPSVPVWSFGQGCGLRGTGAGTSGGLMFSGVPFPDAKGLVAPEKVSPQSTAMTQERLPDGSRPMAPTGTGLPILWNAISNYQSLRALEVTGTRKQKVRSRQRSRAGVWASPGSCSLGHRDAPSHRPADRSELSRQASTLSGLRHGAVPAVHPQTWCCMSLSAFPKASAETRCRAVGPTVPRLSAGLSCPPHIPPPGHTSMASNVATSRGDGRSRGSAALAVHLRTSWSPRTPPAVTPQHPNHCQVFLLPPEGDKEPELE